MSSRTKQSLVINWDPNGLWQSAITKMMASGPADRMLRPTGGEKDQTGQDVDLWKYINQFSSFSSPNSNTSAPAVPFPPLLPPCGTASRPGALVFLSFILSRFTVFAYLNTCFLC